MDLLFPLKRWDLLGRGGTPEPEQRNKLGLGAKYCGHNKDVAFIPIVINVTIITGYTDIWRDNLKFVPKWPIDDSAVHR